MAAVDLVTGALVLLAATAALAGPVAAAMLMHRHGVVLGATAPAWSLGLGILATVLASGSAAVMLAVAWRRARSSVVRADAASTPVQVASVDAVGHPMRGHRIAGRVAR